VTLALRWTEHALEDLAAISPIYAERLIDRVVRQLDQACAYPESGRIVQGLRRNDLSLTVTSAKGMVCQIALL